MARGCACDQQLSFQSACPATHVAMMQQAGKPHPPRQDFPIALPCCGRTSSRSVPAPPGFPRMLTSIRTTTPLLSSTVFLLMGVGLLHTHIALEGKQLGFSVAMIGVLTSGYYTGFLDRKSTRLNSSHPSISYAVFCLKKKK